MKNWLSAAAISRPDGAAVILPDGKPITYAELHNLCAAQAAILSIHGIGQGAHVALLMENSLRCVVLVHAIMRLGAVLIPLNTRLAIEELSYQLYTANAGFLCFDTRHLQIAEKLQELPLIGIDCRAELLPVTDHTEESAGIDIEATCAIVFTSGTSGQPKGAQLTYGNFLYSAMASAYRLGVMPDDRWLICLPMFHVGGLSILYRSCLYNTAVVLYEGSFDSVRIVMQLKRDFVTMLSIVPTQLHRLLQAADGSLAALRLILLGGAACTPELLAQAQQHKLNIAATYGLTEATSQVATALPERFYAKQGNVGRPLPFTSVRILNEQGSALPPGEIGEIAIAGPTVMRGYLGMPDVPSGSWFISGDTGYLDDDGDLHVLQRRSDLIISGGENVYPAEVENMLRSHPDIEDAVVIGRPDSEWGQRVAAAIVLRANKLLAPEQISAFCAGKLAGYKCPREYIFVESLPLTASGKLDRRAAAGLFKP